MPFHFAAERWKHLKTHTPLQPIWPHVSKIWQLLVSSYLLKYKRHKTISVFSPAVRNKPCSVPLPVPLAGWTQPALYFPAGQEQSTSCCSLLSHPYIYTGVRLKANECTKSHETITSWESTAHICWTFPKHFTCMTTLVHTCIPACTQTHAADYTQFKECARGQRNTVE